GHDTTIRGNQHILHVARRDIGVAGLQPVDRVIDLVRELDTVFSGDKPATGCVADEIRNPPATDFRTLEIVGSGGGGRATQQDEKHDPKSDALPLRSAERRSGRTRPCKFWRMKATEHLE